MPLNDVMPDSAPIEAEEFSEGQSQPETPEPAPPPPPPPPRAPEPEPEPVPEPEFDQGDEDDDKASEASKELKTRGRRLDERKATIQESINALVRERGEITRETERGRQERADLQREIDTLRAERERAGGQPQAVPGQGQGYDGTDPRDPKPVEGTFTDYSEFTEAIGEWAGRKAWRRGEYLRHQRETMAARQQWETTRQQGYSTRYQAFAQANPTFEQEINREDLLLTAPMVDVVKDSEVGPNILLHLSRHPEEIDRISALHPVLAFGEMKKIEARLEGAYSGSPQPATQHSKAPAPIKPVGNVASRRSDSSDIPDESVSDDEHFERMNKRDEALRKKGINVRKGYGVRV